MNLFIFSSPTQTHSNIPMANHNTFLLLLLPLILSSTLSMADYDVTHFGAKPDGRTDSAKAFLTAWAKACSSRSPSIIYVPKGTFLVSQALFLGPCKSPAIRILIKGTIVAKYGYDSSLKWLYFKSVDNVGIFGGTIDGRGKSLWACKMARRSCPIGAIVCPLALYS